MTAAWPNEINSAIGAGNRSLYYYRKQTEVQTDILLVLHHTKVVNCLASSKEQKNAYINK